MKPATRLVLFAIAAAVVGWPSAAEEGSADAQFQFGQCFDEGRGVDQDFEQAARWYRSAAVQGHAEAQYVLGMSCAFGIHFEPNYDEAVSW